MVQSSVAPAKPKAALAQRALNRRAKTSERNIARKMVEIDGPDPNFEKITTSTGRVGQLTHLQFDAISKSYVTENKNRVLPLWLVKAWIQIQQRALDFHKAALLHIEPPNMEKNFPLNGERHKTSNMHIITEERHRELIEKEKELEIYHAKG